MKQSSPARWSACPVVPVMLGCGSSSLSAAGAIRMPPRAGAKPYPNVAVQL